MLKKSNPWDIGPTELIQFALERMHGVSDFDKRLSYLVLDIGVETLLKTFLTIPENISRVQTCFAKRKVAVNGNFHELLIGIREAIPDRIRSFNIDHIEYYHDIRNTLYHQGNKVAAVRSDQLTGYAELAVYLLRELLGVDLSECLLFMKPVKTSPTDPVIDSVDFEMKSNRYRIERLRSQSICIMLNNEIVDTPIKPILREIISENSLPITLYLKTGAEKNTRTLGKNIIDEVKKSSCEKDTSTRKKAEIKFISSTFNAGSRIRMIRNEIGLRTSEFAELIGIESQREYEDIENQKFEASITTLQKINKEIGVNIDWLKHEKGEKYEIPIFPLWSIDESLEYCKSLKPHEYFLTLEKKGLHVGLVAQISEYRFQTVDFNMNLDFWNWGESYWAIPAFYHFLQQLSNQWHDIEGILLHSEEDKKLYKGDIHFLSARAMAYIGGGDLLYDLLDIDQNRKSPLSYPKTYGGNWMVRVHHFFIEALEMEKKGKDNSNS